MSNSIALAAPALFTVRFATLPVPPPRLVTAVGGGSGVSRIAATPIGLP